MPPLEPTAKISWWRDVEPSLFANQTIRNFLLQFSADKHQQVVKLVLLQGILSLQDAFGPSPLSVAQLRTIVRDTHFTRTLSSRLPALESQLADTCGILDDFAEEIQNQYSWQGASGQDLRGQRNCKSGRVPQLPLSDISRAHNTQQALQEDAKFRDRHDQSHGPALTQADITLPPLSPHPHWWGDGSNNACRGDSPPTLVARTSHLTPRQVPRLAYTVPRGPTGRAVDQDDVVKPEYLLRPATARLSTQRSDARQHIARTIRSARAEAAGDERQWHW